MAAQTLLPDDRPNHLTLSNPGETRRRRNHWHGGVYVAGAGAGRTTRCAHRLFFVWRCAVRNGYGSSALSGRNVGVITEAILNRGPVAPVRLNPDIPAKLEEIINKALEKDRKLRYQSATEIHTDLQRLKRDSDSARLPLQTSATVSVEQRGGKLRTLVPAAIAAVVLAAGVYFYSHRIPKLTDKDTIVLADFTNTTGDAVFDEALRQGLAVQLEQSPFLSLVSEERIQQALRLMDQPADAKLTPPIARELCQRTGTTAVFNGSIAQIGTQYNLTLEAVNCVSGEVLASTDARASDKNKVLDALGEIAPEMRSKLGESLSTVQKFDVPLENATTPSLEALKAFSMARKTGGEKGEAASIRFLLRAIELDPEFAVACAQLAAFYEDLGEPGLAEKYATRAYRLRDRVSEGEKFFISTIYYQSVTGELQKSIQTDEQWAQSYPRNTRPHNFQSIAYAFLGQYEKAVDEGLEAIRLDPDPPPFFYSNLMEDYLALNRWDDARRMYRAALEKKHDDTFLHNDMYVLGFLEGDTPEMERQLAWASGRPGLEDVLISAQSDTEAFFGRSAKARQLSQRAGEFARSNGQNETAALWRSSSALREAEFGNFVWARGRINEALHEASTRDIQILAALTLARAGDFARAQALSEGLAKSLPLNTELNNYWLPSIQAAIQINRGNPTQALSTLEVAKPYDLAFPRPQFGGGGYLYPVWLRGLAFLLLHRGREAAEEFQKILDHRSIVTNSPIGALAHLGLARAYVLEGNTAKARAAYQDFLTLWKDADPDIPILKAAKAEYAKLQ
jgi:tetratricopeptide (TPR) repeat protein